MKALLKALLTLLYAYSTLCWYPPSAENLIKNSKKSNHRIIAIYSTDQKLISTQLKLLLHNKRQLLERDLEVVIVNKPITMFNQKFHFSIRLINKSGEDIAYYRMVTDPKVIFSVVDKTPLRISEILARKLR